MINSFNSTMCSHVVTLSDGLCQLLQKKRKNIVFAVLLFKKKLSEVAVLWQMLDQIT